MTLLPLTDVLRLGQLFKGKKGKPPSILDRPGFERAMLSLADAASSAASSHERGAARAVLDRLNVEWHSLSPAARERIVKRAAVAVAEIGKKVALDTGPAFASSGDRVSRAARGATAKRDGFTVETDFGGVDRAAIQHAATSQALYVTNEYGRRATAVSKRARVIVAAGLDQGLDYHAIAAELEENLSGYLTSRSAAYWRVAASIFVGRARTFGALSSMRDAGIKHFRIEAVMDEVTCNVCRFMHGQTFSVARAHQRYLDVAAAGPESVYDLQPFLKVGLDEEGRQAIFTESAGKRYGLAIVEESAEGMLDERGTFSKVAPPGRMERLGVTSPPFHGRCRDVVIAV